MRALSKSTRTPARRARWLALALSVSIAAGGAVLAFGFLVPSAGAQTAPSGGNGAKRFDDLRELNNKLDRAIASLMGEFKYVNSTIRDTGHWRRTLNDLEVTKLRAVDQFPPVFGLPYGETFRQLSCVDNEIAIGTTMLRLLEGNPNGRPFLTTPIHGSGNVFASRSVLRALETAKGCKDRLETDLSTASSVPSGVSDDLRELNNKLDRAIASLMGEFKYVNSTIRDTGHWRRTLNDLEVTKLRAVDQFPPAFGLPYGETFRQLSCVDNEIAIGTTMLRLLEGNPNGRPFLTTPIHGSGNVFASRSVLRALETAKGCKDRLEVELMHSFNLKPSEQTEVGVNPTTPNGTDTQNPNKLNAPKTLEHAYAHDGFVGRHEQDYVASGINSSTPDSWPSGRNVLFFDVFDLFGSTRGAQKATKASEQNLKSSGFTRIQDSSLGSGEAAFQKQPAGSSLLSTIIYVQRGTFIMKIAGACNGCSKGSIESSLESVARAQIAQAVSNGFPTSATQPHTIAEEFDYSGSGGYFGQPDRKACIYLSGPIGQTGDVKLEPGDATARSDPNAQTYDQAFTLDSNGKAVLTFTEPNELFKVTINRKELDGSTNTTVTSMTSQIHHPPPWGLPDCTQ